ncbi:MAG: hypothetical protein U9O94_07065 [Nanoarchaeota archaeon]|nr:hypothetical protein [Nanoarchaeota archaeon]
MAINQVITDLPLPPTSTDPSNFAARGDAFLTGVDSLQPEINQWAIEANATQEAINLSEQNVEDDRVEVATNKDFVNGAVNYKGIWSAGYDGGSGYPLVSSVMYNGIKYINDVDLNTATPPTNWSPINTIGSIVDLPTTLDEKINNTSTAQTKVGDLTIGQSISVSSWSYATTTITINTATAHNVVVGQFINISGLTSDTNTPRGRFQVVSVVDTDTITFTASAEPTGTAGVSGASLKSGYLYSMADVYVVDDNYIDLDAIGANPTAKLYSDGSIVGSTDNGSYVKYANGELVFTQKKIGVPANGSISVNLGRNISTIVSFISTHNAGDVRSMKLLLTNNWAESYADVIKSRDIGTVNTTYSVDTVGYDCILTISNTTTSTMTVAYHIAELSKLFSDKLFSID